MPNYQHFGLYFTLEAVRQAQANCDHEPFHSAWAYLERSDIPAPHTAATECFWNAFRYRVNGWDMSGADGAEAVISLLHDVTFEIGENRFDALRSAVMLA